MAKCPVSGHVDVLITCMYVTGVEVGVQMSCIIPFNPLICLALGTCQRLKKILYILLFLWCLRCSVSFPVQQAAMIKSLNFCVSIM